MFESMIGLLACGYIDDLCESDIIGDIIDMLKFCLPITIECCIINRCLKH